MPVDPVFHEQGDNMGDEILNVLEDVIRPTHKLPIEDEDLDNFETEPSQKREI